MKMSAAIAGTRAIAVQKSPWSETSLVVTWISEEFGRLRTVARGVRKPGSPLAGVVDLLHHVEMSIAFSARGDLHTLREASLIQPFDARRAGAAGFCLASYFAELSCLAAPPMHPAPQSFALLARALDYLQSSPASDRVLDRFETRLCQILGVFDHSGKVSPLEGLASLCGEVPASRHAAIRLLTRAEDARKQAPSPPAEGR